MEKFSKSDAQWRAELDPHTYEITREGGTEPPFTGALLHCKKNGTYTCACCGLELFKSDQKYDSGSGWPSFWQPLAGDRVRTLRDTSHGMIREEVRCARCDAHLGHVFPDGPRPTGLRFCVNSASLGFSPDDEQKGPG